MASLIPELSGLPDPQVIEEQDYEQTRSRFIALLSQQLLAAGIAYDVDMLETDPGVILMEAEAYIDIHLRQRINEAIQANFLAYAQGTDIDHLAQFYDVSRMPGETDERLRSRIVLAIRGRSTGGTEPRYQSVALAVSTRVADVRVYRQGRDPRIHVALFSSDNSGIADPGLLAQVEAALNDPAVRMVNDVIIVEAAIQQLVDITADIWLLPNAPQSTIALAEANLRSSWNPGALMGRDVTQSWVVARLMVEGVQNVELDMPATDLIVPNNRSAQLGVVTLNFKGRNY